MRNTRGARAEGSVRASVMLQRRGPRTVRPGASLRSLAPRDAQAGGAALLAALVAHRVQNPRGQVALLAQRGDQRLGLLGLERELAGLLEHRVDHRLLAAHGLQA